MACNGVQGSSMKTGCGVSSTTGGSDDEGCSNSGASCSAGGSGSEVEDNSDAVSAVTKTPSSTPDLLSLGSFFDAPKKRKKTRLRIPQAPQSSAELDSSTEPDSRCMADSDPSTSETCRPHPQGKGQALGFEGPSPRCWPQPPSWNASSSSVISDEQEAFPTSTHESRAADRAASRSAWKLRGLQGNSKDVAEMSQKHCRGNSGDDSTWGASGGLRSDAGYTTAATASRTGRLGRKSATGMYRAVPHCKSDATRCHWLLSPESLLIRVDPETSVFLQRQWLALAPRKVSGARGSCDASTGRGARMSYPARLHAGWLAQTLRPRGWLASIPEDEVRNLSAPLPGILMSEPDRGPCRPTADTVKHVILRELGALGCSSMGEDDEDAVQQNHS